MATKRLFGIPFLCLLAVLVSCTGGLKDSDSGSNHIRFSLADGHRKNASRRTAAVENIADLAKNGNAFAVWGHHVPLGGGQGTSVFDAVSVIYRSGQGWGYSGDEKYWETGKEYAFHALYPVPRLLSPSEAEYSASGEGTLLLRDFDATRHIDLLYADRTGIRIATEDNMPAFVPLAFQHLLSRITFVATPEKHLTEAGVTVTLSDARIFGMPKSGTWNSAGDWTLGSDRTTRTVPFAHFSDDIEIRDADGTDLFAGDNLILMIPQAIGMEYYLEIKYFYSNNPQTYTTTVRLANISTTLSKGWEAGKSYRYRFSLGDSQFILFDDVEATAWEDAEGGAYNVDF